MQTHTPHLVSGANACVQEVNAATELTDATPEEHTAYIMITTLLEIILAQVRKT